MVIEHRRQLRPKEPLVRRLMLSSTGHYDQKSGRSSDSRGHRPGVDCGVRGPDNDHSPLRHAGLQSMSDALRPQGRSCRLRLWQR
jgi:hypothetical protein